MENCRNEQLMSFKLRAVLSSVLKSRAVLLSPAQEANHPLVRRIPPVSPLVATSASVTSSTDLVS